MICKQINTCRKSCPVPVSFLISTAKSCNCDIYIKTHGIRVNVKSYEEMMRSPSPQDGRLLFYFNGSDELAAQQKIERVFQV